MFNIYQNCRKMSLMFTQHFSKFMEGTEEKNVDFCLGYVICGYEDVRDD